MSPSPTNSAIAAAAKAICEQYNLSHAESHVAILIAQHVEPIVRAVEAEQSFLSDQKDALLKAIEDWKRSETENADLRARLKSVEAERDAADSKALAVHEVLAKERDQALAKLAEVTAERDGAWTALGECTCLMDPPDGGEPTLAELVGRMREAWKRAEAKLAEVEESRAKEANVTRDAMELTYAAEKRAQKYMHERDSALSRAERSEALLREARPLVCSIAADDRNEHWQKAADVVKRIDNHLAPKETT